MGDEVMITWMHAPVAMTMLAGSTGCMVKIGHVYEPDSLPLYFALPNLGTHR